VAAKKLNVNHANPLKHPNLLMMDIKDLVEEAGYIPRRKAACHGGEYCSPCPFCKDGNDRFIIWPSRHNQNGAYRNGRYICRVCGRYGDAIAFLRELYGSSYLEACRKLQLEPQKRKLEMLGKVFMPSIPLDPPQVWIEKATAFVDWCNATLLNSSVLMNQIQRRGFSSESIKRYKLGFNPGTENGRDFIRRRRNWGLHEDKFSQKLWLPTGIVIPTFALDGRVIKLKIRRTSYERDMKAFEHAKLSGKQPKWNPQKYIVISGSKECLSVYGNTSLACAVVVESELDALLIQQEADDLAYCIALGGSTKIPDLQTHALLQSTSQILFCPDYDKAGAQAWIRWKKIFPNIERILTPSEKSPGDYFQAGKNIREWIQENVQRNENKKSDVI